MDITQLILDDHHEQRRLFAIVEEMDRADTERLTAVWRRLAAFLETHAEAEEEREGLTDFRRHVSLQVRHRLGVEFATFEARHVTGVEAVDKDPRTYIEEHRA